MHQLQAQEVRVRNAVADALGVLAAKQGAAVWERCGSQICRVIKENYVRPFHESARSEHDAVHALVQCKHCIHGSPCSANISLCAPCCRLACLQSVSTNRLSIC